MTLINILQSCLDRLLIKISTRELFPNKVNLFFNPSARDCSCEGQLQIYKTKIRRISTLSVGECNAHITQLHCKACKKIYYPEELKLIFPKGSHFSFDIIVHVGSALFLQY